MSLSTLDAVPSIIRAGDTLCISLRESDYLSPDWSVQLCLRAANAEPINATSAADTNGAHLISVAATTTAKWTPGNYAAVCRATGLADEKVTFWQGSITVEPDMAAAEGTFDPRSDAEIIRDKLLARIKGKADQDVLNYSVEGVSIGKMTWDQLQSAYNFWEKVVQSEKEAEAIAQGKSGSSNIAVRFVAP